MTKWLLAVATAVLISTLQSAMAESASRSWGIGVVVLLYILVGVSFVYDRATGAKRRARALLAELGRLEAWLLAEAFRCDWKRIDADPGLTETMRPSVQVRNRDILAEGLIDDEMILGFVRMRYWQVQGALTALEAEGYLKPEPRAEDEPIVYRLSSAGVKAGRIIARGDVIGPAVPWRGTLGWTRLTAEERMRVILGQ